jgi:phosphatidylserine/phosphatidylglycerophosphate/cardiolipin synthase-like enzyme
MSDEDDGLFITEDKYGSKKFTWFAKISLIVVLVTAGGAMAQYLPEIKTAEKQTSEAEFVKKREYTVESQLLLDEEYKEKLYDELEDAEESIDVIMYVFRMKSLEDDGWDPVQKIADLLKEQSEQGVNVNVLMSSSEDKSDSLYIDHKKTAEYLEEAEVNTAIKLLPDKIHAKLVLIDGNKLFVGNHNWTWSSLTNNAEASTFFKGEGIEQNVKPKIKKVIQKALNVNEETLRRYRS